jgi:hypothetical protein
MRIARISLRLGMAALVVASLVTLAPQSGFAQDDPFLGTWVLNVAKSKGTVPPPPSETVTIEAAGQGIKTTVTTTDAAGKTVVTAYTANFDGKDYPVTGSSSFDSVALKRVDTHTIEFTRKKAGKVVWTGTNVVSMDGKTRTQTGNGVDAQGHKVSTMGVSDKK